MSSDVNRRPEMIGALILAWFCAFVIAGYLLFALLALISWVASCG